MRLLLSLLILNLCAITSAAAQDSAGGSTAQSAAAPQDNSTKAKALIDQAIQALGGSAYLNSQNISQQGRTYSFHRGEATSAGTLFWRFVKFPDRERIELTKQRDVRAGPLGREHRFVALLLGRDVNAERTVSPKP